jgi:hypothetical protein
MSPPLKLSVDLGDGGSVAIDGAVHGQLVASRGSLPPQRRDGFEVVGSFAEQLLGGHRGPTRDSAMA